MANYICLSRVKTKDGVIHAIGDVVELSDQEAKVCLGFKSVVAVQESQPITVSNPAPPEQPNPVTSKMISELPPETPKADEVK